MNKEEIENKRIKTFWWNSGKKTKDFEGTYKEYLKEKGIKTRKITHKERKHIKGTRFTIELYTTIVKIDFFEPDNEGMYIKAIKTFMTLLGDKALLVTEGRREYKINWW